MKGVCADEKIGQNPPARSAGLAIGSMRDSCGVCMVCRERDDLYANLLEPGVELGTMSSLWDQLSVDGGRDNQGTLLVDLKEQRFRPIGVLGIIDEHIQ